jgi:integrase
MGQFSVDDGTGRRRRVTRYGRTQAEVRAKLAKARREMEDSGAVASDRPPTVEAWARHWLDVVMPASQRAPGTVWRARGKVERYIAPHIGGLRLDRVTPQRVERLYADLLDHGGKDGGPLSPQTVLHVHRILSRLYVLAGRKHNVRNPCDLVDPPTVRRREVKPLTAAEARQVAAAAAGRRNGVRWLLGMLLGLRQGEALGLCWDDLDIADPLAASVTIRHDLERLPWRHGCPGADQPGRGPSCGRKRGGNCPQRRPPPGVRTGGLVLGDVKTHRSKTVPLLPALAVLLAGLRDRQPPQDSNGKQGPGAEFGGLVFTTPAGGPIEAKADWAEWQAILDEAGLPRRRVHELRHTMATGLRALGVSDRTVMAIAGWTQRAMLDRYDTPPDSAQRQALEAWGEQVLPAKPAEPDRLGRVLLPGGPVNSPVADEAQPGTPPVSGQPG